jgi:hypothetical protein
MSKIALQGDASGTGTFTIASPNSNTDRTLTLPDEAGTVLTSDTPLSSFPSGFANGITQADNWRLTSNRTSAGGQDPITANLERSDDSGTAYIGDGMTESSGVFTFPETGLYMVMVHATMLKPTSGAFRYMTISTQVSTDGGSNWDLLAISYDSSSGGDYYGATATQCFVNVTSTTNVKVRFTHFSDSSTGQVEGSTSQDTTGFKFIRLGDSQ